ncbi:MAG: cysteine methyltransferase [Actinobacteria bacterium]|nr:cysteine methyltransferase [Actinomycetota bacterium]
MNRDDEILAVVLALRAGEVVSYGDVADTAGWPGRARLVGRILAETDREVPWWRVVAASGRLVPGAEIEHGRLLRSEGVEVVAGRVRSAPTGRFSPRSQPQP